MKKACRNTAVGLAALVLLGISSDRGPAHAQGSEFKIGWILPQVGPVAEVAKQYMDGFEVALEMINASGGFGGVKGRLIVCDSQNQESQAVICAKKLINDDQINLLLGATGTPPTIAIEPTVEATGVPMFALAGGSVAWVPVKKWVFKTFAGNDDQIPAEMDFLKKKGWLKAALIRDNSVFGNDTSKTAKEIAAKKGVQIITDEVYAPTDTDVTAQVTRIRALNPDVILNLGQNVATSSLVSRKIVQLGIATPIILGTNNVVEQFVKLTPESIGQSYFAGSKVVVGEVASNDPLYGPITGFLKRYKEVRGSTANMTANTPQIADAILFTATVAKPLGAKALDRAAMRDAIEGANHVPGIQGFWGFTPTNHASDFSDGVQIVQYVNNTWKPAK
jgi:branched-chain amino acid transport system substrate-binding protein